LLLNFDELKYNHKNTVDTPHYALIHRVISSIALKSTGVAVDDDVFFCLLAQNYPLGLAL